MSTQSKLSAHNAVEQQRKSIAARLAGMIWHPSSIRRAFGSQDESTGPRSTLQPDAVFSNGASKGAAMLKEATRNWKVGACQIKHEATIADPKDGCTMRFAILIPFSNGQERGQTSVPASIRIAGGRLYINNEQRTAEMARKASRGEHLSATDEAGMKRTAQFEDAPRASKSLEDLKAKKDKIVKQLDDISAAVDKAVESARKRALKSQGQTEETIESLETGKKETLEQYAKELQQELQKTKARVLKTSDGLLVTLDVRTKRNPKYESVMTFLTNFFSRAGKFVDTLIARYTWMSKTMSAFETDDPKAMTRKLKQTDKNIEDLDQFKQDRSVADGRQRWKSDKFPPEVNAPASEDGGPIEERYGRLIQAEEGLVETSSGDIGEDFRDARDDVRSFNNMLGADEETAGSLADDQQLDAELPQPVTEVGDRVAHRNIMMLPFDSGRTAAQEPNPALPFSTAAEVPMSAFKRVAKKHDGQSERGEIEDSVDGSLEKLSRDPRTPDVSLKQIADRPDRPKHLRDNLRENPNTPPDIRSRLGSKREALLADGWSEAEVDAHLAGSK